MKLPLSVCEVLRDHVVLESECIDRMYLNVYVPQLQRIGGVVWYLRGHLGQRSASIAGVAPKTDAFVANIERFVAEQGVEMVGSRIKQYHKEGQALRTETTINDTRDFGVGRLLKNLPELRRIGFAANRRLLEIEQISHDCALGDDAFQQLQRPRQIEGQRASALRFGHANVQAVLNAVLMFVFVARGFTNKDLRQQYAVLLGKRAEDISSGRMSYELRRLRLHGLIERLPKTRRYRLTDKGLRTALFYTRVYSRILRPAIAPAVPDAPAGSSKALRQFHAAEEAVNSWCDEAHIAA